MVSVLIRQDEFALLVDRLIDLDAELAFQSLRRDGGKYLVLGIDYNTSHSGAIHSSLVVNWHASARDGCLYLRAYVVGSPLMDA